LEVFVWRFFVEGFLLGFGRFSSVVLFSWNWWSAAALVDDYPKEIVRLAAPMGPGGDHGEDGDRKFGVEAGQGVAEGNWMFVIPAGPEDEFDFGGLPGAVPDGGDERGRGGGEVSAGLAGEFPLARYGCGELGDGI